MLFSMFLQVYAHLFSVTNAFDLATPQNFAAAIQDVAIVVRAITPLTNVLLYKPPNLAAFSAASPTFPPIANVKNGNFNALSRKSWPLKTFHTAMPLTLKNNTRFY